jgi:hypothetical protein
MWSTLSSSELDFSVLEWMHVGCVAHDDPRMNCEVVWFHPCLDDSHPNTLLPLVLTVTQPIRAGDALFFGMYDEKEYMPFFMQPGRITYNREYEAVIARHYNTQFARGAANPDVCVHDMSEAYVRWQFIFNAYNARTDTTFNPLTASDETVRARIHAFVTFHT